MLRHLLEIYITELISFLLKAQYLVAFSLTVIVVGTIIVLAITIIATILIQPISIILTNYVINFNEICSKVYFVVLCLYM